MNPLSPVVLGAAAVCTSPALYQAVVTGGMPLEVALTRYLVALGLCWLAMTVVATLVGDPPAPASHAAPEQSPDRERPPGVPAE